MATDLCLLVKHSAYRRKERKHKAQHNEMLLWKVGLTEAGSRGTHTLEWLYGGEEENEGEMWKKVEAAEADKENSPSLTYEEGVNKDVPHDVHVQ